MIPYDIENFFNVRLKTDILIICGPTGSGKSSLALEIANKYSNIVIINLDAYQVYIDIPICSASPTLTEKATIKHYLYNYIPYDVKFSVGQYLLHLEKTLEILILQNKIPILVGGSSLYIHSVLYGINKIAQVSGKTRQIAINESKQLGNEFFFEKLIKLMPELEGKIHKNDSKRLIRNYEFFLEYNQSLLSYNYKINSNKFIQHANFNLNNSMQNTILEQNADNNHNNILHLKYNFTVHKILKNREDMYIKSDEKILEMIKEGAIEEVQNLLPVWEKCEGIRTALLVKEIYEYLNNKITLEEAIQKAQLNTRRFIKKQYCWLKNKI